MNHTMLISMRSDRSIHAQILPPLLPQTSRFGDRRGRYHGDAEFSSHIEGAFAVIASSVGSQIDLECFRPIASWPSSWTIDWEFEF